MWLLPNNLGDLKSLVEDSIQEVFPVLDSDQKTVMGIISMTQIRKVMLEHSAYNLVIVEDMMTAPVLLREEMDLHLASQHFLKSKLIQLPVIDSSNQLLGLISYQDIIHAYDQFLNNL